MLSSAATRKQQYRQNKLRAKLRRRLEFQTLEQRRLLAVVAGDGFESADLNGGTEQWAAGTWNAGGDATIRSDTSPQSGSYHARLRRSSGDLQRIVDVTGLTDVRLQFASKQISFERADRADVKVSGDGTNWTTIQSFVNGDDDGVYHTYDLAVSDLGDTLYVRFDAGMSGSADYWFIDDVQITATTVVEQRGNFLGLGFLPGQTQSNARGIASDGRFVVGNSGEEAYRWSKDEGMISLGVFSADDVTDDGSVVVGGDGVSNAYRWENGVLSVVGDLTTIGRTEADPGGTRMASIHRVSSDGSVMVGNTAVDFKGEADSFRIVGTDIQPIGDLPDRTRNSGARAVSADGSVVVGRGNSANGNEAYRWENGIFTPLGDLPGGAFSSLTWTVSDGGEFVVGQSESSAGTEAYLWSSQTGMVGLGHLSGETTDSRARGVSGDGSIVVGVANHGQSSELLDAFIWDAANGMRNLQSVLIAEYGLGDALAGWTLNRALAISEDGLVITGVGTNPSGLTEAFVVELEDIYPNVPPTVNAGADQTLDDIDGTGAESVMLVGSAIDSDGTMVSVQWLNGAAVLGTDSILTTSLPVGVHTLIFTATDDQGASSSDSVEITVTGNQTPFAVAGPDQTLSDAGGNGDEFITLMGSGTDSDGEIVSYEWKEGTTVLGTTASISPTLALGTHSLTFTVTDNGGASASDTVVITINEVLAKPVKVFLLAGQSNMTGTAEVENLDPLWNVPQEDAWIWLDHNMDGGQWTTVAPGHGLATHAPRPDEPEGLDPRNRLGPELSLSKALADAYPDYRVALIKHGDGGRDVASHFNPENIGPPDSNEHMWSGLIKKTDDAFAVLDAAGYTYEVEGFFWAMGGGDARNRSSNSSDPAVVLAGEQEALARSAQYGENLTNFITAVRDRYAEDLPFVMTRIADDLSPELLYTYPGAELVRQGQLEVAASDPWTEAFLTEGISKRDAVHYDAAGQIEFGTRLANTFSDLVLPAVDAGDDVTVVDNDENGSEQVLLTGSGSAPDGSILSYQWSEGATTLGNTATISPNLSIGTHTLTLTVTDSGGATASDTVVVTVMQAPSEAVLFEDSFEVGSNSNDWNGKWVEDSQNDFFRSTQRSTDGARSAEVDGRATNATLTTSASIDISGYVSAELTFDWLIEKGFERGEYLSLDVSTNGGASWIQNVRQLRGNVDTENAWHNESVDLSVYNSSDLKIRFRSYVSSSREDANIDNVKIVGSGTLAIFAPAPMLAKTSQPSDTERVKEMPVAAPTQSVVIQTQVAPHSAIVDSIFRKSSGPKLRGSKPSDSADTIGASLGFEAMLNLLAGDRLGL